MNCSAQRFRRVKTIYALSFVGGASRSLIRLNRNRLSIVGQRIQCDESGHRWLHAVSLNNCRRSRITQRRRFERNRRSAKLGANYLTVLSVEFADDQKIIPRLRKLDTHYQIITSAAPVANMRTFGRYQLSAYFTANVSRGKSHLHQRVRFTVTR